MRLRPRIAALLSPLLLLFAAKPAHATSALPSADAHVSAAQPTVNFGSLTNLDVGNGATALVQFDLSSLPAGTTAAQVSHATLRLYPNRVDTAGLVSVQPVLGAWAEYTVTASALPSLAAAAATVQVNAAGSFVTVDITSLVQSWITTPAANHGIALSAGTAVLQFDSKENDLTSHPAELDLTLVSQGPAGATGATGPQGVAGATGPTGATGLTGATGAAGPIGPAGAAGATGPQGSPGILNYQGTWSSLTTYPANAVVTYAGSSYLALASENLGRTPGLNTAWWGLLAAAGQNGASSGSGTANTAQTLTYQGAYVASASYSLGDIVQYLGSSYISLLASNHGNTPGISSASWGLLAAAGASTSSVGNTTQSLMYQGTYVMASGYGPGDIVQYGGSAWISLIAGNHGNTPGLNPSAWGLLAAAQPGAAGPAGPTGTAGPTGPQGGPGAAGPQGLSGPAGVAGAQGLPGLAYRGPYTFTTNYAFGDVVLWQGASYTSLVGANHGNAPDLTPGSWGVLTSQGSAGPAGPQGPAGLTGAQGLSGLAGPPGPAGPAGPTGVQGPTGAQGLAGLQGSRGDTGAQGLQGTPGQAGTQGIPGIAGPQGTPGVAGAQGPAGPVGLTVKGAYSTSQTYTLGDGVTWNGSGYVSLLAANRGNTPDGSPSAWILFAAAGAPGAAGAAGPSGPAGTPGSTGAQGPAGVPGATGATGPQGPPVANYTGNYSFSANYALNDAVSYAGSTYVSLIAGNRGNAPDSSTAQWAVLAARGVSGPAGAAGSVGPAGPAGPAGAAGGIGPAGPQGAPGAAGPAGLTFRAAWASSTNYAVNDAVTFAGSTWIATQSSTGVQPVEGTSSAWAVLALAGSTGTSGAAGSAATVSIGTVTTGPAGSSASVTNSGTANAAVLNFTLPQGAAGTGGSVSGGSGETSGIPFASVIHAVVFGTTYYSVNTATSASNEAGPVLTWVPGGCTATKLTVYSLQSNPITVTLRTGTPGSMSATSLACSVSNSSSCTVQGSITVTAGTFVDYSVSGANGTASSVWTALTCD